MRFFFMIVGLLVCSMLLPACGAFGPKQGEDLSMMGTPAVNIPRSMVNADDDPAIGRDFAHIISVTRGGDMYVAKNQYPIDALSEVLTRRLKENPAGILYIQGDFDVEWGKVAAVLDAIRKSGSKNVNLIVAKGASDNGKAAIGRLQADIPPEPTDADGMKKPNPLTLEVKIGADGKLRLNDNDMGSIDDPTQLGVRLKQVFEQRQANSAGE